MPRKEVQRRATARIYVLKDGSMEPVTERKIGTVYSVNPTKGWLFLYVTPQDRYFVHLTELKTDRFAVPGDRLSFIPAPPRKPGQLPCAIDAHFVESVSGGAK